jgi:DNA-3-methyladenine glycosylase
MRAKRPIQLGSSFYERTPDIVAKALLGKVLVRRLGNEELSGRITEVEAYFGLEDPASHAYIGRTSRNAVLFGPPGVAYVYFIYGMYYCLNVSCQPDGQPGGVLFRALYPLQGLGTMARLRKLTSKASAKQLTGGPGRLCQALGIARKTEDGIDMTESDAALRIFDDGYKAGEIITTPRIGLTKAADRMARYLIADPV